MPNDELGGRAVVNLLRGALPQSGSKRTSALTEEAQVLAKALVSIPDRVNLFEHEGQVVHLEDDGRLRVATEGSLAATIRRNVVTIILRDIGDGRYEKTYLPVEPTGMAVRMLLTQGEPNKAQILRQGEPDRLIGRLPLALVEEQQQEPPPPAPEELISNPIEAARGRQIAERWAMGDARREAELRRGAELAAREARRAAERAREQSGSNPAAGS
jgi:hypothetical protein